MEWRRGALTLEKQWNEMNFITAVDIRTTIKQVHVNKVAVCRMAFIAIVG